MVGMILICNNVHKMKILFNTGNVNAYEKCFEKII